MTIFQSINSIQHILVLATLLTIVIFPAMGQTDAHDKEESLIKEALRLETQHFYERKIDLWAGQWSHNSQVMKCYVRSGIYTEQLGWATILSSAQEYMRAHPNPETPPTYEPDYQVKVAGNSALVTYVFDDPVRGRKREIRWMVKENGQWKISFMSTNYYTE